MNNNETKESAELDILSLGIDYEAEYYKIFKENELLRNLCRAQAEMISKLIK